MPVRGVIFDLDGVLIDTGGAHLQSWRALAAEQGLSLTEGQFLQTFGRPNRDIIPFLWGPDIPPERIAALSERKEALYREIVRGRIPIMEGADALVRACAADGLLLAIGSSTHPLNLELTLEESGWRELFCAAVSAADVTRGKPDPQVFQIAAQRLALPTAECVVIEDAPAGVQAARAAGCVAVGLTSHHPAAKLASAHLVVDTLRVLTPDRLRTLRR